jgi:hypothetical protein
MQRGKRGESRPKPFITKVKGTNVERSGPCLLGENTEK